MTISKNVRLISRKMKMRSHLNRIAPIPRTRRQMTPTASALIQFLPNMDAPLANHPNRARCTAPESRPAPDLAVSLRRMLSVTDFRQPPIPAGLQNILVVVEPSCPTAVWLHALGSWFGLAGATEIHDSRFHCHPLIISLQTPVRFVDCTYFKLFYSYT